MLPLVGQEINGSRIWLGIPGVISFQPGEDRQDRHRAVPGRLPGAEPRDALGVHVACRAVPPARHPHLAATLAYVGPGHGHRRVREGPGQRARAVLRVPGHALCRHGEEVLSGHRAGTGRRGGRGTVTSCSGTCRPASASGSTPLPTRSNTGYQIVQAHLLHRRRRPVRRRHRARHGRRQYPGTWKATSSSPPSARRRGFWARRACCFCTCASPSADS